MSMLLARGRAALRARALGAAPGRSVAVAALLAALLVAPATLFAAAPPPPAGDDDAAADPAEAADEAAAPAAGSPEELASIPIDALRLRLRPLTDEELAARADQWMAGLRAVVQEISENRLAKLNDAGDAAALDKRWSELTQIRARITERIDVVLTSLERKGGDPGTRPDYVAAVSNIEIQADDAAAWVTFAKEWAASPEGGIQLAINVGLFLVTLIVAWIVAGIIASVVRRAISRMKKASALLQRFLVGLVRKTVLVVGLVVALDNLGLDIGPLVAAIGAAGLVIGFALQGTLSNFASGILILLYRPFDEGDFVSAGGTAGKVEAMSLVSTTMITPDNQRVVVPNNSIWNNVITNVTGRPTRRVDLVFGISYDDDIAKAIKIMEDVVAEDARVLKDPAPNVRVTELADSSVNFICRPWVKTADYWDVYWDITRKVKERFDAEDITIPYPQQDVYMHQVAS